MRAEGGIQTHAIGHTNGTDMKAILTKPATYHVEQTHEQVRAQRQHRRVQVRIAREVNQRHQCKLTGERGLLHFRGQAAQLLETSIKKRQHV